MGEFATKIDSVKYNTILEAIKKKPQEQQDILIPMLNEKFKLSPEDKAALETKKLTTETGRIKAQAEQARIAGGEEQLTEEQKRALKIKPKLKTPEDLGKKLTEFTGKIDEGRRLSKSYHQTKPKTDPVTGEEIKQYEMDYPKHIRDLGKKQSVAYADSIELLQLTEKLRKMEVPGKDGGLISTGEVRPYYEKQKQENVKLLDTSLKESVNQMKTHGFDDQTINLFGRIVRSQVEKGEDYTKALQFAIETIKELSPLQFNKLGY